MVQGELIPVIVLNWNGIDDTILCVEHLMAQSYSHLVIHLADNGSDTENVRRLEELSHSDKRIKLTLFDSNLGFTEAHNRLMSDILSDERCPEYILLINNDAFADKEWAGQLIEMAESKQADMVSSLMINYFNHDEVDNIGHRFLNTAEIIPKGTGEHPNAFVVSETNAGACAGAALYRTSMLKKIGCFDPYFNTGYEDAELGVRALVMGHKSVYAPGAKVYHKISQSVSKIRDFDYVLKTPLNIFYTYFKLMPFGVILVNLPFLVFKYGVVLLLNILFGKWFFFKVMRTAIWKTITTERAKIKNARRTFFNNADGRLSSYEVMRRMEFFLWFDISRFYKHLIRGEKTQFEKVNQSPNRE